MPDIDHDLDELKDPATWDDDEGTIHSPVQNPSAVVSVRLTPKDVERLEHEAAALGLRLPEFIRHVALQWLESTEATPKLTPVRRPA